MQPTNTCQLVIILLYRLSYAPYRVTCPSQESWLTESLQNIFSNQGVLDSTGTETFAKEPKLNSNQGVINFTGTETLAKLLRV